MCVVGGGGGAKGGKITNIISFLYLFIILFSFHS